MLRYPKINNSVFVKDFSDLQKGSVIGAVTAVFHVIYLALT